MVWVQRSAITAAALAVAAAFLCLTWILWNNRDLKIQPLVASWQQAAPAKGAIDAVAHRASQAIPDASKVNQVLETVSSTLKTANSAILTTSDTLNRPCGRKPCGTLPEINKDVVKMGDAVVQTQLAERAVLPHTIAAMDSLTAAGNGLKADSDSLNALLKDEAVYRTVDNLAGITGNLDDISRDAKKVSDKMTADYLKPVKWYMVPVHRFGEIWDVAAAVARHTP